LSCVVPTHEHFAATLTAKARRSVLEFHPQGLGIKYFTPNSEDPTTCYKTKSTYELAEDSSAADSRNSDRIVAVDQTGICGGTIAAEGNFSDPMSRPDKALVLIVEDEALVRVCTAVLLEEAGCEVIEAADGEEALRAFEAHAKVTTVFTDINMPGPIDGLSLAHRIFRLRPQVQLIITSGRGPLTTGAMPAGGVFLPKPYDYAELTALIRAA
jgi:CheY-like chemotaxis protein